jgi:hypothetical protein
MNRLPVFLLCSSIAALSGCAYYPTQAPAVGTYPEAEQKVMEAAHHWDLLAEYQAGRILAAVKDKSKPIYIEVPAEPASRFREEYRHMLSQHLVDNGGVVITEPVFGGVKVEYFVEVLQHKNRVPWTTYSTDPNYVVWYDEVSYAPPSAYQYRSWYNRPSFSEVVVTTRVREGNLVLMSDTHAFYYNPGDTAHYTENMALLYGRAFQVVDR